MSAGRLSRVIAPAQRLLADELTLRLVRDRYPALARLRDAQGGADWFPVRMLGRKALVVRGEEGVRTFYDSALVVRRGAVPAPVRWVLFGPGAVHGLDGEEHRRRKKVILDVVDREAVERLCTEVARRLDDAVAQWIARQGPVTLYDELVEVYGEAVLDWAGTGTRGDVARAVSWDLATIVDGFGIGGTAYPRAVVARVRAQRWALRVVRQARRGALEAPEGSPVAVLASTPRTELPDVVAATELLNIVRPTVAVAYFGAYAAQALSTRPDWRPDLAVGSPQHLRAFEHEIRRWYPFTPLLTGRLRRGYRWDGVFVPRGGWLVLDVLGTNRDPASWDDPEAFRPERFLDLEPTAFDYVPHGGGDPAAGHRCPGEPLAVAILAATLQRLAQLEYDVPDAARQVPLRRIPSLPPDRMTLVDVRSVRTG